MKLPVAAALVAAATVLAATPALAARPAHSETTTIEQPATAGMAGAESFVLSTGLTDGQLIGNGPKIRPVFADGVTVTKVEVLVEGVVTDTFSAPVPEVLTLYMSARWETKKHVMLTVRAYDADGGIGEASTRVRVETHAPLTLLEPRAGATVSGVVKLQFFPRDPDMDRIEAYDQSGRLIGKLTQAPWIMYWDTTGLNGPTTLSTVIRDHADNNWDFTRTYQVDNAGPAVASISPEHDARIRGDQATDAPSAYTVTRAGTVPARDPLTHRR
ncbi:hypothetical protein QLQ12_31120 [Actinoplanes sp. NEAU-A12]|uniref:Uncharacterized protein n=1 Tax=Actinoplanes sandaracinus TaxID=3045177 RepID=A0ABT6WTJ7_9ACTN|nr:hypothetical protein [Actinoplanes sandaracinus]MDI6103075.1 hypothetical protein [Actinoplanes sandaracinus]